MALFAGDKPIMTGDELTYDYNFDPFSAKNVQECRCGSENCRGVLGPKPKDNKPVKDTIKAVVKAPVQAGKAIVQAGKAGKRRLMEMLTGGSAEAGASLPKKRKIKEITSKAPSRSASKLHRAPSSPRKDKTVSTPKSPHRQIKKLPSVKNTPTLKRKGSTVKSPHKPSKVAIEADTVVKSPAKPSKILGTPDASQQSPAKSIKNAFRVDTIPKSPANSTQTADGSVKSPKTSPKKKHRRSMADDDSDGEYRQPYGGRDVSSLDAEVRTSGRKRRSIIKEDSGTIHVISAVVDEDDFMV